MERYVEAFERSDWDAATAFWADDVVLHVQGRSPLAGDFCGKQAFLDHYGGVVAELGGMIELAEVYDVLVGAKHAVALTSEDVERHYQCSRQQVQHHRLHDRVLFVCEAVPG